MIPLADNVRSLRAQADALFESTFHGAPTVYAAAPGRVNLMGEHIDYNGGCVLPMAIERHTLVALGPCREAGATLHSAACDETVRLSLDQVQPGPPGWANYARGVIAGFQQRNIHVQPFRGAIVSDLPMGAGLSSSAAFEVALATALEALTHSALVPADKARLCQQAEHRFAGTPCGIMDQFASTLARAKHALWLDCQSEQWDYVPFSDPLVGWLIADTGVKHALAQSEYSRRRAECEAAARLLDVTALRDADLTLLESRQTALAPVVVRRARHVITEMARSQAAASCMRLQQWRQLGELMYASHTSLRDDFEVTCPELDFVVNAARTIGEVGGMYGCRMTGGGFGGCVVALVRRAVVEPIIDVLQDDYAERTGGQLECFLTQPAQGAIHFS